MPLYCLDANFFIRAWNEYYSPDFCKAYWEQIASLGSKGKLFVSSVVQEEIEKKDDVLKEWLREKQFLVRQKNARVIACLQQVWENPAHHRLIDQKSGRSAADPWIIAHAMAENAVLVTREKKDTDINSKVIKIPNVCENLGVRYIDDFQFIREMQMQFDCKC